MIDIRQYCNGSGHVPIDEWLQALRDQKARARILVRLRRLSLGLEGDREAVGEGVRELRIP